jgi:hypothetical protein
MRSCPAGDDGDDDKVDEVDDNNEGDLGLEASVEGDLDDARSSLICDAKVGTGVTRSDGDAPWLGDFAAMLPVTGLAASGRDGVTVTVAVLDEVDCEDEKGFVPEGTSN